ncbi:MAG: hypothetical protein HC806_06485 [Anaerolineae bacterium]|nr:hypothetical protein [Anaerolineae bacterium]
MKTALTETFPHRFIEILVQPLSSENSNALVDHLLTVAELPSRVRTLILEKSEGNPFFLEEIVRTLIEDGVLARMDGTEGMKWQISEEVETIDIPDNLQTLLAARLDRLNEDTRKVLQMAAVIGRTFYYRVLQNISQTLNGLDGQLVTLQRTNMILEAARLPELEFAFRHALVQETAYRSILRKQRREFHRKVGETMESLFASRLDEYAPVLAMHFERAGDSVRAFDYYLRAGMWLIDFMRSKKQSSIIRRRWRLFVGRKKNTSTTSPNPLTWQWQPNSCRLAPCAIFVCVWGERMRWQGNTMKPSFITNHSNNLLDLTKIEN